MKIQLPDFVTAARGALFDLDGVIVDTARHHYLAWRELAAELGFEFTEIDNERLKGVSRMHSLEILLEIGKVAADESQKADMAARKNARYVELISALTERDVLPGAREYLLQLRAGGVKTALGSASKNAPMILASLRIADLFDAVVDGNHVTKAKPDPEVFLSGAGKLGLLPAECVVYEDAEAGVEAAHRAGMKVVGIGSPHVLKEADHVVPGLFALAGTTDQMR